MPVVKVIYDNTVSAAEAQTVCQAIQTIVSEVAGVREVVVYGDSPALTVGVDPIEIFVQAKDSLVPNPASLLSALKSRLEEWKQERQFPHPINITVIPMHWEVGIGV